MSQTTLTCLLGRTTASQSATENQKKSKWGFTFKSTSSGLFFWGFMFSSISQVGPLYLGFTFSSTSCGLLFWSFMFQLHLIQALISRLYHLMEAIISKLYNLMSVIFPFILSHLNPPNLENSNQLSKIEKIKKSKSMLGTWQIS